MSRKKDPLELFDRNDGVDPQLVLDESLVKACMDGDIDSVIDLLQKGASVEAESFTNHELLSGENYTMPLMGAVQAKKQQYKIASMLLDNGADVNSGDRYNVTALHVAAAHGQHNCVRLLLDAGAKVNAGTLDYNRPGVYRKPYKGDSTALHLAARDSHIECIEELIQHGGADYNRRDAHNCTCLNYAAQAASQESILALLRLTEGRQIFSIPMASTGDLPLHDCVRRGFVDCVRELLLRGADANRQNAIGLSALHFAALPAAQISPEMMETLVTYAHGLDINQPVGGSGMGQHRHGLTGVQPLELVAFEPDVDVHAHNFHTAEFRLSRTFKLITSDPRRPARRPQCAVHLIRYGANFDISYKGQTLLQQEVYRQDASGNDSDRDSLLVAIVRAAWILPLPGRPTAEPIGERGREKLRWLQELFASPRSLQQCCRVAIRRFLGPRRLTDVNLLPLPSTLQNYLLLKS